MDPMPTTASLLSDSPSSAIPCLRSRRLYLPLRVRMSMASIGLPGLVARAFILQTHSSDPSRVSSSASNEAGGVQSPSKGKPCWTWPTTAIPPSPRLSPSLQAAAAAPRGRPQIGPEGPSRGHPRPRAGAREEPVSAERRRRAEEAPRRGGAAPRRRRGEDAGDYVRDWATRKAGSGEARSRCFLPFLVGAKRMILEMNPEDEAEEDGANIDLDSQRKGKCVVLKALTRHLWLWEEHKALLGSLAAPVVLMGSMMNPELPTQEAIKPPRKKSPYKCVCSNSTQKHQAHGGEGRQMSPSDVPITGKRSPHVPGGARPVPPPPPLLPLRHRPHLLPPHLLPFITPYISSVSSATPSIAFRHLPSVSLPPSLSPAPTAFSDDPAMYFEHARLNNPNLHQALSELLSASKLSQKPKALVVDFFYGSGAEVAAALCLPAYYYFPAGANPLAAFLYLPTLHKLTNTSFKDLDGNVDIPGVPPIPAKHMPSRILDRSSRIYGHFLETSTRLTESAGLISNTFEALETRAVKAISEGLCVPDGRTPPVYCIGPLVAADDHISKHDCLSWLDSQPSRSVLFMSFGSMGVFSSKQLREIAHALERSGFRFLWVVRNPPPHDEIWRNLALKSEDDPGPFLCIVYIKPHKNNSLDFESRSEVK
ncbi:hypothetical protein NL676_016513 [Syzygium grande]|nr:hypothetical protein NL676_016513 [Syzygium grande]